MPPPRISSLKPGITPVNIILKADQRSGRLTSGIVKDILTSGDHPRGVKVRLIDGRVGRVQSLRGGVGGVDGGRTGAAAGAWDGKEGGVESGVESMVGRDAIADDAVGGGWTGNPRRSNRDYLADGYHRGENSAVVTSSLMEYVKAPKQKRKRRKGVEEEAAKNDGEDGSTIGTGVGSSASHYPWDGDSDGDVSSIPPGQLETTGNENSEAKDDNEGMTPQKQLEAEFPSIDTALVAAILSDHEGDVGAARETLRALV